MTGYDNKALFVLPSIVRVDAWENLTWYVFNKTLDALVDILSTHYGMSTHLFNGSPILENVTFLSKCTLVGSVALPDRDFLVKSGLPVPEPAINYPSSIAAALKKFPARRGISAQERVTDAEYRERFAEKHIIDKHYKVIFDFEFGQDMHLNLHPKANDGKIIFVSDKFYRITEAFINAMPMQPSILLNNPTANSPIESWRF